ncbi:MAG: arsenic efflux protein [Corallococcus sp.]|nr:arsenic efflux protein [Corallococcus sp.]
MLDVFLDALIDSAKILPFLFLIYIFIEFLETNEKAKHATTKLLGGKVAPLVGGSVGLVPQCGFSVMAADLYMQSYLKTGTLLAVLIATSDEALPILLTNPDTAAAAGWTLLIKFVYAVAIGYLVNLFDRRPLSVEAEHDSSNGCCRHDMSQKHSVWEFLKHPVLHTVKIFCYILVVNFAFGTLLYFAHDAVTQFMAQALYVQPLVCALIGLIPNCGSSVILTGLYSEGIVSFGAMLAGLVSNSGIAVAVMLKDKRSVKRALLIMAALYISGVLLGEIVTLVMSLL